MNKDLDPAVPIAEPSAPPVVARRSRRRVAAMLNANALLAATALIIAIDPKNPPFRGD